MASKDESVQCYLHGNRLIPIYSTQSTRLTTQEIVNILLNPNLDDAVVCHMQPICIEQNSVFVVNVSSLKHLKDIYCDDMGSWKSYGSYKSLINVDSEGDVTTIITDEEDEIPSTISTYEIKKRYFRHGTASDLKKNVILLEGKFSYASMHRH